MASKSDKINNLTNKNGTKTSFVKRTAPRKVISSQVIKPGSSGGKSCSTGVLDDDRTSTSVSNARPKKTTKSDFVISQSVKDFDFCRKCGDALSKTRTRKSDTKCTPSQKSTGPERPKSITVNDRTQSVAQYYRNENFQRSTESVQDVDDFKKISLDTIKELPERRSSEIGKLKSETTETPDEEIGFLDTDDINSVKRLKEFRETNYFECHSAKSRIENKVSAISLKDHKCTYRFYLNDRLFPVPVSSDHHGNIRCVECHLPLDLKHSDDGMKANGFIQAKIRIGNDKPRDTVMYLPVKDQLIIRERKRDDKKEEEVVYFGVIKLDRTGDSLFSRNLPSNSFALKYQKGYKEYHPNKKYELQCVDIDDVVVI
ncbi:uncharacterized protein LOC132903209 [Amyelois transitella]|uniref:uncharacterized protein LOC132903209 n=1 Tax=Amyelois transitella TaxID=680683 RepID=UPI00298FEF96|nr:uncharacterized protein LOC132903209 [Amyelois transitella]